MERRDLEKKADFSRYICFLLLMATLLLIGSGCSVVMAARGKKGSDINTIRVGSTQIEVENQLGKSIRSIKNPDGTRTEIYEHNVAIKPSPGRAVLHAVNDVLTFGIWEIFATSSEIMTNEVHISAITFGKDNRVISINQLTELNTPEEKKKNKEVTPAKPLSPNN